MKILFFLITFAASLSSLANSGATIVGVWQGDISGHSIIACFSALAGEENASFGAYYYTRYKNFLPLKKDDIEGEWHEQITKNGKVIETGRWVLNNRKSDEIHGHWTAGSGKLLRISLNRIATKEGEAACTSHAFLNPIQTSLTLKDKKANFQGKAYQILNLSPEIKNLAISTIALPGETVGAQTVNHLLREKIIYDRLSDDFSCMLHSLPQYNEVRTISRAVQPTLWTQSWLSVRVSEDNDCGGFSSSINEQVIVFNLKTGQIFDINSWLKIKEKSRSLPIELQNIFKIKYGQNAKCETALTRDNIYAVGLRKDGLIFIPDYGVASEYDGSCINEFLINWQEIIPHLNEEGKRYVVDILSELKLNTEANIR